MEEIPDLNEDSIDIIHNIFKELTEYPFNKDREFFLDAELVPGGLSIMGFENGEFISGFHFLPAYKTGKIHAIKIDGFFLDETYNEIYTSGMVFGFKFDKIQITTLSNIESFLLITIEDYNFPKKENKYLSLIDEYKSNWIEFKKVFESNNITKLYHFTDKKNLESIRKNGGLYSWWKAEKLGIEIPMPGGNGESRYYDKKYLLQNYVRLCFTKNHPMRFIAEKENRIINPVILEIKIDVAFLTETKFSNMNAAKTGHSQGKNLEDLKKIRFDLVLQPNHFNISDSEKKFYQAEILVLEKIPLEYITNINSV